MRTKLQQLYDRLYYGAEISYGNIFRVIRCRRITRDEQLPSDFYRKFRKEVVPYWKKYGFRPKPCWYKLFYAYSGTIDPRYIPDDIHHKYIVPYFDDVRCIRVMEDKNLHSLVFPGVKRPETVFKHVSGIFCEDDFSPLDRAEAYARCLREGQYILKPTRDTGEGLDIRFFSSEDGEEEISALLRSYDRIDYIVQKILVQHPDLARLNPGSVNTIRIVTVMHNNEVTLMSPVVRIGGEKSRVDNVSRGGYQTVIHPDGTLNKVAFTHRGGKIAHVLQTDGGVRFEDCAVPCWDKVCETTKQLAIHLPHLKLIGWDLSVDENGDVVLIEFNCDFGSNQETSGPTFGDMTEEILDDIFIKNKRRFLS